MTASAPAASEADRDEGWQRRRLASASIRFFVTVIPVVASFALGLVGHAVVPAPDGLGWGLARMIAILAASLVVLGVTDNLARRLLPLAALLQLSLVFPDQTPSRFRLALRSGSGRRLARAVEQAREEGLSDEPTKAAEQLLLMASAIGDHDRRTRGHSERVRLYAELIGEELGLDADERAKLQWAALIHDIGKVTVPPEILNKKGKPDDAEWAILKGHPMAGEDLAAAAEPWLGEWVHAVGGHHERWDGTGYPRGLRGEEIPRSAAIVAVADSFEVMTAVRSYKPSMPLADARRELTRCAGAHFSPEVVRAFLNLSIGDLRRSMGLLSALAHLPFLGRVSSAAAYAPDTVATAVGATTSAAGAGAGAVAVTAALAVSAPVGIAAAAPSATPLATASSSADSSEPATAADAAGADDVADAVPVVHVAQGIALAVEESRFAVAASPRVKQLALATTARTSFAAPAQSPVLTPFVSDAPAPTAPHSQPEWAPTARAEEAHQEPAGPPAPSAKADRGDATPSGGNPTQPDGRKPADAGSGKSADERGTSTPVARGGGSKPAESGKPTDSGNGKPVDSGKPADAGKPTDNGKPTETGDGGGSEPKSGGGDDKEKPPTGGGAVTTEPGGDEAGRGKGGGKPADSPKGPGKLAVAP